MKPLKRGDIAIAQYFEIHPEYNGEECTVLDGLQFKGMFNAVGVEEPVDMGVKLRYRVQFSDGKILGPLPHQLRPRDMPDEGIASNDEQYFKEPDLIAA